MGSLQEGFFRLTIVVSVITGLLFLDVPGFEDSYSDEARYFRQNLKWKYQQQYEADEIYFEDENTGKVFRYESHPNYFKDDIYRPTPLKWFQKVFIFFKVFLLALLSAIPYVLAVWVIYFTIRFVVTGFIGKNENT